MHWSQGMEPQKACRHETHPGRLEGEQYTLIWEEVNESFGFDNFEECDGNCPRWQESGVLLTKPGQVHFLWTSVSPSVQWGVWVGCFQRPFGFFFSWRSALSNKVWWKLPSLPPSSLPIPSLPLHPPLLFDSLILLSVRNLHRLFTSAWNSSALISEESCLCFEFPSLPRWGQRWWRLLCASYPVLSQGSLSFPVACFSAGLKFCGTFVLNEWFLRRIFLCLW